MYPILTSPQLAPSGGLGCVHGPDWFRRASEGGRDWSGGRNLHAHAEQGVCVRRPQHLHDRPQSGTHDMSCLYSTI